MLNYILVGAGSAAGGISRCRASSLMVNRFSRSLSFGTLSGNLISTRSLKS